MSLARTRERVTKLRVLARLASLAQIGELARRLFVGFNMARDFVAQSATSRPRKARLLNKLVRSTCTKSTTELDDETN